jgi:hypothetical protein
MKQTKTTEEEHKSNGIVLILCLTVVFLTLADTWLKLNAPAWHIPFWICVTAIGITIAISYIRNRS